MTDRHNVETIDLANGIRIEVIDESRRVAGDRWYIRLVFRITVAPCTAADCLEQMKATGRLTEDQMEQVTDRDWCRTIVRERNFVAEQEADMVRSRLRQDFDATMLAYLGKPSCAMRIIDEQLRNCDCRAAGQDNPFAELDSDDGPADFSFLFRE